MSFDAGTIFARLGLDTDDFDKALVQLGRKSAVLGAGLVALGAGLTAAITLPIVNIGKAALQAGAEAAETENLFKVSFGNMAGAAENWAKRTSDALGLNEFELKKQSGTIFNMTTSMGLARDEAFEMSTGMTKLAADMASFRNIPIEEAFAKLRSGITGEAEPLKQLGILVTENFVKQTEFAKSIEATGRELTEAQKVTARWQAILKQTGNDQGDLARTMDSPINQIRRFRETMAETSAKLGQALLPVLGKVLDLLQPLANAIQKGVDAFAAAPLPIRAVAIGLVGLAAAIGPVLVGVGTLTLGFGALSASVGAMGFASVTAGLLALKGAVLAAGSAILGVLLPAAAALAVAIAAFQVGKWIDDFFGFSTVIGDTITNLLNLKAAATEVNRIQFTAMQKASEGMGRQVLDWGEATRINAERIKALQDESLKAAGTTATHSKSIQEQVRELLAAKESTDLLAKASSLAGVEITDMAMAQEVLRQATKVAKTELDHLVESFEARTFEGIAKEVAQVNTALARMKGTLPIEEAQRLRDEWEPWVNELKLTAPALQAVIERANAMRDAGKRLMDAWIGPMTMALPDLANELSTFGDISSELPRHLLSLGEGLSNAERKALGFPPILETMSQKTESFGGALQQTSILLATFHKGLGSIFGAGASFAQGFSSLFGEAGGVSGFKKFTSSFTKAGKLTFGSFFTGLGNALPAIGALVGPVVAAFQKIFSLGGPNIGRDVGRDIGVQISEGLEESIKKSGLNAQMFLSDIFGEGNLGVDRFAQEVGDLFSFFERGEISKSTLIKELTEDIPILIEHMRELGPAGEEQIQRILAAADRLGVSFQGLQDLSQSMFAPETMEQIAAAFGITNDQVRELSGLLGVQVQTDLERMAASLGLSVEEFNALGAAVESQFGIPMNEIGALIESMGISASDLAGAFGVEVASGAGGLNAELSGANSELATGVAQAVALANELERAARASGGIHVGEVDSGMPVHGQHGFRGLVGGPVGPVGFVAGEGGLERVTIEPLGGASQAHLAEGPGANVTLTFQNTFNLPAGSDEEHVGRIVRLLEGNVAGVRTRIQRELGIE